MLSIRKGWSRPSAASSVATAAHNHQNSAKSALSLRHQFPSDKFQAAQHSRRQQSSTRHQSPDNNNNHHDDLAREESTKTEDDLVGQCSSQSHNSSNKRASGNALLDAYLVEAVRVDEENEEASHGSDSTTEQTPSPIVAVKVDDAARHRTFCVMTVVIVILVAALVAIVVGVVVLPSSSNDEESVSATESSSTVDEMTSPFFAALPNATMASLQDVESPQSQALELLFGHPNYGTMEDWKRIQLFAMATYNLLCHTTRARQGVDRKILVATRMSVAR